ncbi:hypothetical protein DFP94_101925 [Fontibacillus phaseoli]|uniref:Uncharacterized protein n=1 Tax=Fontibacillus phaseoli TaxID=1416533 RepID=A0A369BRM6_9BACL|nr:hypothetical protein DFP94_101925 [Fontibacillus phaseoli]
MGHVLRLVFIFLIFLTLLRRMMHFGERYVYLGLSSDSFAQYFGYMLMKLPQRFAGWLINFFDYIFTFLYDYASKILQLLYSKMFHKKCSTFYLEGGKILTRLE